MTNMKPGTPARADGPSRTHPTTDASVDVGRRRVLEGTAAVTGVAALFALGAAAGSDHAEDLDFSKRAVRPPGSVEESEFLARCLRCDRCRSVCHTSVIGMTDWSDGLVRLRTPVLDFRLGHCDFCGLCARVCPTGAILPFPKETTKVGLAVLTERCIALRTAACRVCEEKCPYDAVTLDEHKVPVIDPEICNGCGLCENVCPANVFQSYRTGVERGIVVRPFAALEARDKGGAA